MENKHSCQEEKYIISPHQCRVGRALLKWSQSDLAKMSEMSPNSVANFEKEKQFRSREFNKTDKHFFMQFQINPEDVSSGSGEIKGWLSPDAIPVKGTIEDVVFFGDLWGGLKEKNFVDPGQRAKIPTAIRNLF